MLSKETETYVVVITAQPLKNKRYKIEFSDAEGNITEKIVHEETLLNYRLVVGKELDRRSFSALIQNNEVHEAYAYCINILSKKMFTIKEIDQKLYERKYELFVREDVILKLEEMGLLNDEFYAEIYIENQVAMKNKSKQRILVDLYKKGISSDITNKFVNKFDSVSEIELLNKEIEKLYFRYKKSNVNDFEIRGKVVQSLSRKGFDYSLVRRHFDFFLEDLEAKETIV